ncbi:MAG: putative porin [Flavobacteriaceae bacterium]
MRFLFFTLIFFLGLKSYSQQDPIPKVKKIDSESADSTSIENKKEAVAKDSLFFKGRKKEKKEIDSVSIKDYKIISHARDTVFLDTTLTIKKEYKYNYLRKDDFELMPFSNIGRPYNALGRTFSKGAFYPQLGASTKHYNYFEVEDINYYNVPTPITELMFKTTLEQGQLLDALLTFNTSKKLNVSIAFKGFRSLGKYQYDEAKSGNFRASVNYTNEKNTYAIRGHFAGQKIEAEENGGLSNLDQFENDTEGDFTDRSRIDVLYTNATNRLVGKRYFLDHRLRLINYKKDSTSSTSTTLTIGHEFNYESKRYDFVQSAQNDAFGNDPFLVPIEDRARLKTMSNKVSAEFSNKILGSVSGNLALYNYNYFFNSMLITELGTIQNQLKGEEIVAGGEYNNSFGRLDLRGNISYTVSGALTGNSFNAAMDYKLNDNNSISGAIIATSRMPDFNFLLYQSEYRNFNWQNTDTFENQRTQSILFSFDSKKWGRIAAEYSNIDNYTYFESIATEEEIEAGQETAFVQPFQETATINHLRVKYAKEFSLGRWALNNTVLYQNVTQDEQVLNVPQLVTRNTLYFSKDVFKKAMFLQTGVTFKYFTSYNMNAYNPLLGEFYIQDREELGGYPLLDFFINAKVKQTRIYLKVEHFNSLFSEPNFYAAPNYPYRDFVIRFGLVWNLFS